MADDRSGKGFLNSLFNKVKNTLESTLPGNLDKAFELPPEPAKPAPRPAGPDRFTSQTGKLSAPTGTTPLPFPAVLQDPAVRAQESQQRLAFIMAYLKDPASVPQFKDPKYVYKIVSDERTYQSELCGEWEGKLKTMLIGAPPSFLSDEDEAIPAMDPGPDGEPPPEVLAVLERLEAKRSFQAERQALEVEIQKSRDIQTKLFLVLKNVTGIRKKTGGTGFITPPPGMP
jgi:hypothetical protein